MPEATINRTNPMVQITLLGGFELKIGDKMISDKVSRTHQLWNLLEYLIAFRHKTSSQEELIAALWPDNRIDNPASALKNLVYRIRTTFAAYELPFAKEMLYYHRGTYHWNNSLTCTVDTEEFERIGLDAANPSHSPDERIALYRQALELYRGDFLPGSAYEEWAIPLASHYRARYFACVAEIIDLLQQQDRYPEIQAVCQRAILIDPFEESVQRSLILSLIRQNQFTAALDHYSYVTNMYYRELGVKPSETLRGLYREITKTVNNVEADLNVIKDDLNEHEVEPGAFYCDYEVFKHLYRVEARTAVRTGQTVFIALLTVSDDQDRVPESKLYNKVMDQLLQVVRSSLRKGDVVSRFSSTQYVLMLPSVTFESGAQVLHRIAKNFKLVHRKDDVKVHSIMQPLDPLP